MLHTLYKLFHIGHASSKTNTLLNQHKKLITQGLHTTAEVLSVSIDENKIGNLFLVKLHMKIKSSDQKFEYILTQALLPLNQLPANGKFVQIRYFPDDLKLVLVK